MVNRILGTTLDSPEEGQEMTEALKGITAELYEALIAVVDERVKEIRVTREDFSELKGIVTELAHSHNELRGAVTELAHSHNELRGAVKDLAQAQARTEKAVANLAHQVGRMSDTIGYWLEDLGQWVLPAYFERTYGITGVKRCIRKFIEVDEKEVEINLYAEGKRNGEAVVLLGESKNRIRQTEVKKFMAHLKVLEKVLKKPAFRFLFGFWAHPNAERLARENNIEVISSYQLTR